MGCQRQIAGQIAQAGADFKNIVGRSDIGRGNDILQGVIILQEILSQAFAGTQAELLQQGGDIERGERDSGHGSTVTRLVGTGARK